ncbi:hypothetical protein KC887_05990 [Candidatus Kaiserbacteria bacterium]|nr:hypothetical protein [Candidatus Kaiserbacteria bacterium]
MQYWSLDTEEKREYFMAHVGQMILAGKKPVVKFEAPESHITQRQFSALHVWCGQVAETLNNAGLDMKAVIKPEVSIDWNKHTVKEYLYKPILSAMTGKDSTTKQDTSEPNAVANTIARHLGEKFGVVLPEWPNRQSGRVNTGSGG